MLTRNERAHLIEHAIEAAYAGDMIGYCLSCGAEHDSCEPDARNYKCDECGKRDVFGAEELLLTFA